MELDKVLAEHDCDRDYSSSQEWCPACAQKRLVEWLDKFVSEGCDDRVGGLHEPDCQCGFGIYIGYKTWQALKKALDLS